MDKIFEIVGLEGNYQKKLLIINLLTGLLPVIYAVQVPFLTKHPNFLIEKLKSEEPNKVYELELSQELCNSSLYKIIKNPNKSIINWSYTFDLYCERETYITAITSIFFVGQMIGTLLIIPLSDKYGRSKILKVTVIISLILHLNLLLCIGPIHLIIINFIGGIFSPIFIIVYSLFTEFFPKSKNGLLIGIFNSVYPLTGILLCFFFMVSYSWRFLYLITSLIHIYYTYLTLKYFLESPRWLHSVGNKEKCLEVFTQLGIYNDKEEELIEFQRKNINLINKIGTPFLENEEYDKNNTTKDLEKSYNIMQILKFKSQRIIFIKITIIYTCSTYNYFGIALNLGRMKGNFYLNTIFAFLGEFICKLISGKLSDRFGRIFIILCCCALGIIGYILYLISLSFKFLFIFISMIGFAGIFNILTIYQPEIYPTKIRNITYSYTSFISRISPISAPIIFQFFPKYFDSSFIIIAIIATLIGITLEETLNKKIIDIIPEEQEDNGNSLKNKNYNSSGLLRVLLE